MGSAPIHRSLLHQAESETAIYTPGYGTVRLPVAFARYMAHIEVYNLWPDAERLHVRDREGPAQAGYALTASSGKYYRLDVNDVRQVSSDHLVRGIRQR